MTLMENSSDLPLSVVVPCYNEEESLSELYTRVVEATETVVGSDFEFILVDDGSSDQTRDLIQNLSNNDTRVVGVLLARNHGHQLALTAGLSVCRGERVFILDADLQDPPELLSDMMALMDEGADVVYGQRLSRKGETALKKVSAKSFYWVLDKLTSISIPRDTGDFRLIDRRVLDVLNNMEERDRFIRGMVSWVGFNQVPLHYRREKRFAGTTKYPFRKMLYFATDAITSFSTVPLRVVSYIGYAFSFFALLMLIRTLVTYFQGETVAGWASVMVVLLLLGGLQLIALGIIGQYVGRIFMQSKGRPLFVIESVVSNGKATEPPPK